MEQSSDPMHDDLAQSDKISAILKKCIDGEKLTDAEQQALDLWLAASPHNRTVFNEVMDPDTLERDMKAMVGVDKKALWGRIKKGAADVRKPGILSFFRSGAGRYAAAIALLIIGAGVYFLVIKQPKAPAEPIAKDTTQPTITPDLQPGKDRAVLQLADGTIINLDEANNGLLTTQGNTSVNKDGGGLNYSIGGTSAGTNTLNVPRNGKYKLELSDGTKVYLNAESNITYPVAFTGNTREVTVVGEALFEVAKDAKRPFRVTAKGVTVEVLGTHFNVNTYADEDPVQVTLLEGSVKAKAGEQEALLQPGQQSVLTTSGRLLVNPNADVEKIMAWRDNTFDFRSDKIETIMNQLSRWYDVEIEYENGQKPTEKYTAQISRNKNVSAVFKALQESGGVHFRIEGKKIIVSP
jgi:transmembrane sensor